VTATASVRFGGDGNAEVQSYVRLTTSTHIQCCTYEDAAPILSIHDGQVDIVITNPGRGEVTADDVTFGRDLAEAVTRYAAELEKLAARNRAAAADPAEPVGQGNVRGVGRAADRTSKGGAAGAGTSGRPWVLCRDAEEVTRLCAAS
jgi:hypothetical protein